MRLAGILSRGKNGGDKEGSVEAMYHVTGYAKGSGSKDAGVEDNDGGTDEEDGHGPNDNTDDPGLLLCQCLLMILQL